jgi:hypothetical protein
MNSIDLFESYVTITVGEDGSFVIPARLVTEIKTYFKGKTIEIIARKKRSRRSCQQNRYLHLLFNIFSAELINYTGDKQYTPSVIKEMMKFKFLLTDIANEETGEITGQYIKGTHELKKSEMIDFIDDVVRYAAENYGIKLPMANEQFELI